MTRQIITSLAAPCEITRGGSNGCPLPAARMYSTCIYCNTVRGEHAHKTRIILGDSRTGGWSLDLYNKEWTCAARRGLRPPRDRADHAKSTPAARPESRSRQREEASWSTQLARGEDYASLAQAFLYAGARTVMATLWKIGDDGAAALAERFYANLRSLPPAEALAAAQRALSRDARYSSPYYWAAYQVIGSNEPVRGAHSGAAASVQQD